MSLLQAPFLQETFRQVLHPQQVCGFSEAGGVFSSRSRARSMIQVTSARIADSQPSSRGTNTSDGTLKSGEAVQMSKPYTRGVKGISEALCNAAENFIVNFMDPAEMPSRRDPNVQLADNFAPVEGECPPTPCPRVEGKIPSCIAGGVYVRNGPNPLHPPAGGYHNFDGHGMLHAVKLGDFDATASYACRWTKTSRFLQEVQAGRCLFPNPLGGMEGVEGMARMGLFAMRVALGVIDYRHGDGPANAGLLYHDGRLLAMAENDMPYAVEITKDGDLVTLGRVNFAGDHQLKSTMTAHPKLDPHTGELYAYSYNVLSPPYLRYFTVSADGVKSPDFIVDGIQEPVLMHDFAVTENFAVFPEPQITFRLQDLLLRGKSAIVCDAAKVPRVAVIPKRAPSGVSSAAVQWFSVPDFTSFHFINGWEEQSDGSSRIVLVGSRAAPLEAIFDEPAALHNTLHEVHLDLATGEATLQRVSPENLDVGQLNHRFLGRKMKYAYLCMSGPWPKFSGVAKVDIQSPRLQCDPCSSEYQLDSDPAIAAWRKFGDGCYGSEPFFVPRSASLRAEDEDDGYLLCYVHNERTNVSELLIMDARSRSLDVVATIELPFRVPYGFHGYFVSKEQLAKQSQA